MRDNYDEGLRCGNGLDEINGKLTGVVRVSFGAMSNNEDVKSFMSFLNIFVDRVDRSNQPASKNWKFAGQTGPIGWTPFLQRLICGSREAPQVNRGEQMPHRFWSE
ncbi:MAG: hypothetical protein Q9214_007528 [Letrouitia sp. 1 TL-2023]